MAGISGVQIGPGATLFTRMPFSPSIWARLAEKFAIAALVAAYGASVGDGMSEFTDELPMIDDPGTHVRQRGLDQVEIGADVRAGTCSPTPRR